MAVGNILLPKLYPVAGISLGTSKAGIKQHDRDDLLVLQMLAGGSCAAVFTQNAFCAAPVEIAKSHLSQQPRWLIINSGNANAGTGKQGLDDAINCCASLAQNVAANEMQVLPFSTGVIGEYLPVAKIQAAIPVAIENLSENNWSAAAHAIMTTDTFAKGASKIIAMDGGNITLTGISKGAGMIQPNMATMLGFIATDANIEADLLQECLQIATDLSFNRITVDGDTSTNDSCVLMASASSKVPEIVKNTDNYNLFLAAIIELCKDLSEAIIRDGEGATKLIRIQVAEALNDAEAVLVAKTIAHSPLVKTAFFACDPNWGRILAAVGRAEITALDITKIGIYLDNVCIVNNGERAHDYTEVAGQAVMDQAEISIVVKLGRGEAIQEVLTCDLSYDYVKINAEYRT